MTVFIHVYHGYMHATPADDVAYAHWGPYPEIDQYDLDDGLRTIIEAAPTQPSSPQ